LVPPPHPQIDLTAADNVLDRWIAAAGRSLVAFVRTEMEGYRLYTVVPRLVAFVDGLTNVYVRYNRKRLKVGGGGGRGSGVLLLLLLLLLLLPGLHSYHHPIRQALGHQCVHCISA
jgi:isoleucyl-tRNA synthetase